MASRKIPGDEEKLQSMLYRWVSHQYGSGTNWKAHALQSFPIPPFSV